MKNKVLMTVLVGGLIVASAAGIVSCATHKVTPDYETSEQFHDGQFQNQREIQLGGFANTAKILWRYLTEKRFNTVPEDELNVQMITPQQLAKPQGAAPVIYRLGHSSLLLQVKGENWLIDPVFAERASPFSWVGPKRFHAPPIALDALPEIRGVIISHDHYDHLDAASIKVLAQQDIHFIVPLGLGRYLTRWGVEDAYITELDWWQDTRVGALQLTATPAQHFSGRGLNDTNQTLWASWVIDSGDHRLFYSGDSGYFDGFKTIGERFGPFDLTMIENGAYNELWRDVHMSPEESLQAHLDLKGKVMMPVHNGTFDLAMHPWFEPLDRIFDLAWEASVSLALPKIGEAYQVGGPRSQRLWWEQQMKAELAAEAAM